MRNRAALALTALLLAAIPAVHAETRVSGIIANNARWTADKGPYIITGDLLVAREAHLVITPGAVIRIGQLVNYDQSIHQYDHADSQMVAIKIEGMLSCIGRKNARIVFSPLSQNPGRCTWYGIVFDKSYDELSEIAFADIAGSSNGVTARGCAPLIRNCVIEYNNLGIDCREDGSGRFYNNVIAHNYGCGIRVQKANPVFFNNIVAFNRNTGLWCDGSSSITFEYNCVFGNADGDFLDCDPELGAPKKSGKKIDSTDVFHNVRRSPVFAGSTDDSVSAERDLSARTDKSRVTDTTLARALNDTLTDSLGAKRRAGRYPRYWLSPFSPCVKSGNPEKRFRNADGSRNDMGIFGGQEMIEAR